MTESLFGTPPPINAADNAEDRYWMSTRMKFKYAGRILAIRYWGATFAIDTATNGVVFTTGGVVDSSIDAFPTNLPAAWNTVTLSTPCSVNAGEFRDPAVGPRNRYAANTGTFTTPMVSASDAITGTAGRFTADPSATPIFPATSTATWFGIDVIFEVASTGVTGGLADGVGVSLAGVPEVSPSAGVSAGDGIATNGIISVTTGVEVAAGVGAALQPSITLEGEVHLYTFGPCEPWDPIWPQGDCAEILQTATPEVTGWSIQAASEILYQLTAQRFSLCQVVLRPCRQSCYGNFPWYTWWEYGTYPQPYWWNGTWYNLACGSCPTNSCSCPGLDETLLPGPVASVTEVKVDGVALVAGVDYRVDDYRKLVRLGGQLWPFCQNMNLADTEIGTWSTTVVYGEAVPIIGRMAVGELGLELVKYIMCADDCAIPRGTVDISRQGVSMTIANMADLFNTGFIQLRMCDLFIKTANPNHNQARSAVYDLDSPENRAWGTAGL